jgi:hypothetical protein
MDILTEEVIQRFRKLVFSRLCSFKNLKIGGQPKLRPAAPWYRGPIKLRLPPLKAVLSLDTRPTTFARPSVRATIPSGTVKERAVEARKSRAQYAKAMQEKKRLERIVEKKKEEDELAALKAEKKKEADEKRAQQVRRVAADKKVDRMLKTEGFEEKIRAKGAAAEKRQMKLLEKAFDVPAEDRAQLLAEQEARIAAKTSRNKTDDEDQVACLVFKKGTTKKDPPDAKTKNISKIVYPSGGAGTATQIFKYNFFLGRTASGKVFEFQLSPEWVEYVFNLVFTQLVRRFPGTWFRVPIGSAMIELDPSADLYTNVHVTYRQRENDYCLPYSVASCLQYMNHDEVGRAITEKASEWCGMPGGMVLDAVRKHMMEHLPCEGQAVVFNKKKSRHHHTIHLSRSELVNERTPFLTLIRPVGKDGSSDHAVCVVDDLIFDSRLAYALKLCEESLDLVCGSKGMAELGIVFRFCMHYGRKQPRQPTRPMEVHW